MELCGVSNEIISFTDSQEAMDYIQANSSHIAVIFFDLNMPEYNGWDILTQMKSYLTMPVYMLTSSINEMDVAKVNDYPVVKKFISKPLSVDFVNELKMYLSELG